MKKLHASLVLFMTGAAFAAVPRTYTTRDYVQDGLVAQWDGRENAGYDLHAMRPTYWSDLVGRRTVSFNGYSSYTEDGVNCNGNSTRWAKQYGGDYSCFNPSADGITVELTVTLGSATASGGLLTAPAGSGVAIYQNQSKLQLSSGERGAQPVLAPGFANGALVRLSIGYVNGEVSDTHLYCDGAAATRETGVTQTGPASDGFFYLYRASNGYYGNATVHAVRVYNRLLTADEVALNAKIDRCRFNGSPSFEVVSGSVTADGALYGAGDKVYAARNGTAAITAANDAVIRPVADGSARFSVTGCSVTLEAVAADEMVYVESLALGADAELTLPSTGLGLNAANLTAEATASVQGAGLLVSAAATSPVTLGENVTYRAAAGTFAGWPASGVAYIPVGSFPTNAAASDVAGLDAIVFLDDGTAAADATTISCTASEQVTLSAKMNGPGVIAAASGGGMKVTGNNARFRGNFDFNGVDVEVANEYGLGSSVSRTTKIVRNETSKLVFDNGASVFTNYAKLWINNANKNSYRVIGSASADKKLVQAETLEFGDPITNPYVYLDHNIDLLKGYRTFEAVATTHPRLSAMNPGECHIYGEIYQAKSGYGWLIRENTHFHQAAYNIGRVNQDAAVITCEAPDVFPNSHVSPNELGNVLDLNGYDQHVYALNVYNNVSAAENGAATHVITSGRPALLVVKDATGYTSRPQFTGKAGYEHASTGSNVLAGVESTSEGELKVSAGTLTLRNGYSWVGKKVTVTGGRLVLDSAHAIAGGKACLTLSGDGVLEVRAGAACVVNAIVCGETEITEPKNYTVAELHGLGFPVEGAEAAVVNVVRSYDGDWTGWPTTPGATAVVPKNLTVSISDADIATVAALAAIDIGPDSTVVCSNAAETLVLPRVQGFGSFEIIDSLGVVLAGDSSGLLSPGSFMISNSCVIVSNRYGLGSSVTGAARVYCGTVNDVLTYTGAGVTNDVALQVWTGTGANGGFVLGSPVAGEVFVQNAGLRFMTGNTLWFRNAVRFANGAITYDAKTGLVHFHAGFLNGAPAKEVWLDDGSLLDAGARRCFFSGGAWHLGGSWSSGQLHPNGAAVYVCERTDALNGRNFSPYAGVTFDLNGYDQGGLTWGPEYDGAHEGTVVTSAVPAKVTIASCSYSAAYDTYAVSYRGEAGLKYNVTSKTSYTTTLVNRFSDTIAPLEVAAGTLVFADGAGWGGTNVTVRSGATLKVEATSAPCAFKPAAEAKGRANLVIENGGTLNLVGTENVVCRSLVYDGQPVAPGRYTASTVGVTGAGTLVVRMLPGKCGLFMAIR